MFEGSGILIIMKYRKLGTSEIKVSVLSLGTWQLADSGYWGRSTRGAEAVRAAIDAGINLFDSAEVYAGGKSEKALGQALGSSRDKVLIATKISSENCAPKKLRTACERSLRRLGTDRIDIYQVHWPSRKVPFSDTFEELIKLKEEGKIREIGLSNFGRKDLGSWMSGGTAVSNQLGYNLLFRAIEYEIVSACIEYGLGILAYMPLMQGILVGKWKSADKIPSSRRRTRHFSSERKGTRHGEDGKEDLTFETLQQLVEVADEIGRPLATMALAWVLARPWITSVVVGGRKPEQIERNLAAAELELAPEIIERLDTITKPLKESLGANADMWEGEVDSRIR